MTAFPTVQELYENDKIVGGSHCQKLGNNVYLQHLKFNKNIILKYNNGPFLLQEQCLICCDLSR